MDFQLPTCTTTHSNIPRVHDHAFTLAHACSHQHTPCTMPCIILELLAGLLLPAIHLRQELGYVHRHKYCSQTNSQPDTHQSVRLFHNISPAGWGLILPSYHIIGSIKRPSAITLPLQYWVPYITPSPYMGLLHDIYLVRDDTPAFMATNPT